ncbi:outer membrane protein assembly factor BamB family protein [Cellulomonas humilata]|uniref:Outer membrane protein assembly factor BamB n=1 Tax=Cellulomonas humilata TaxID=144055 RepID=A0ABU0EC46_9CELL|nr:PQQ-binding-like beta-propeller repeat protein [Cellulomonas humilata]MDQ0372843.1 outer membrane protein assembly factor BamB [Cellulomonas humilata]
MATRSGMAEVELVEHDDDVVDPVDHVGRARVVVRARARGVLGWIGRHRVLALATVVATVVAVGVPAAWSVRSERARLDALAAHPGIAAPLASAPDVAWTSPATPGSFALTVSDRAWIRDDVLILWEQTGDSTNSLRAVDVGSGNELWTSPLSSVPDLGDPADRATNDVTTCSSPEAAPGQGVVVCLVTDSWQLTVSDDDTQADLVEAATVRLRTFDAATGETVLDRPLGSGASFTPIDSDVVVAERPRSGDGPARVVRLDPSTGTERWAVDIPHPVGGAGWEYPTVQLLGDEIGVGWLGTTTLFTGDGGPTGVLDTDIVWQARGHRVTAGGAATTQLRDLDTGRVIELGDAREPWIDTDDRSEPDLLILQSEDRLAARDLATGQLAWRVDWPAERTLNLVVVDGMLARQTDDALTVLDLRTGEQLWRRSMSAYGESMVTDGRRLVVIASVVGTGPVVAAYDARDGRRVWEAPVPIAVQSLAVVDHRLFAVSSEGVVAFGAS